MPALTTRYGLYKPGGGSTGSITPDEIVDIDKLNGNFDAIDAALGSASGTSGSRPSSPKDGQIFRESDTGNTVVWSSAGSYWAPVGIPVCSGSTVRDSFFPNPKQGITCIRTDKGWTETYYELYNSSTNPSGAAIAGWYPVAGNLPRIKLYPIKTGISGITNSMYCFGGGGAGNNYIEAPANDYASNIAFDPATGKITPSVVGRYKVEIRLSTAPNTNTTLVLAASINSTTSPTAHPAGSLYSSLSGTFAVGEYASSPSPILAVTLLGEVSTTVNTDYIQLWFSSGIGNTSIQPAPTNVFPGMYSYYLKVEYVGPPILDH